MKASLFQKKIYEYYKKNKRPLPWRSIHDPYKILVSEIMLQQTQSARVIPKYKIFLKQFPSVKSLADAKVRDVLKAWQGLGYNRRALLLYKASNVVMSEHHGKFPITFEALLTLPGVGPYTASAIMSFAYNKPSLMVETNIRAVFIHFFFSKKTKKTRVPDSKLLPLIETYADNTNPRRWYNALMDYGVMLKDTMPNPSRNSKHHVIQSKFQGSVRQVRGAIIKAYTENPHLTLRTILGHVPYTREVVVDQLKKLKKEGFFD